MIAEGLIKLPAKLYHELESFMLNCYFSHVYTVIEKRYRFDEDDMERAERLISSACKLHDVHPSAADIKRARAETTFKKIFTLEENVYGEPIKMRVTFELHFDRQPTRSVGTYDDETGFIALSPYNMHMTGPSLYTLSSLKSSLSKVDELIAHLKHELTHLVQYRALSHKNSKQAGVDYDTEASYDDSYALSKLEFDPLIKSAQGKLSRLEAKYKRIPGYSKQALHDAFLSVAPLPSWMSADDQSEFFRVLKRRAPVRWKKAVKLFTTGS